MPAPFEPPACGTLPDKGCRMLEHVYESARERGFSKRRSAQQAWGAVKRHYVQGPDGVWRARKKRKKSGNPHGDRGVKKRTAKRGMTIESAGSIRRGKVTWVVGGPKRRKKREKKVIVAGKHVIEVK